MADISIEQKEKTAGDFTWAWAAAAIVAVLGLMIWLFTTQETTTQVMTAAAPDTAVEEQAAVETVDISALGAAPEQYVDRTVRVDNVPVTSVLGNRTFWADVPGANPLLVNVGPAVADASWVAGNGTANVVGTVHPVTEAEVDRWVQGGALLAEARVQAMFATHYFQVSEVR